MHYYQVKFIQIVRNCLKVNLPLNLSETYVCISLQVYIYFFLLRKSAWLYQFLPGLIYNYINKMNIYTDTAAAAKAATAATIYKKCGFVHDRIVS